MYLSGISLLQKNQISFWPTSLVLAVQLTCSKLVRLASRTQEWNTSKYSHPGYHPGNSPNNSKQSVYHVYWQEQLWQHTSYAFTYFELPGSRRLFLRVEGGKQRRVAQNGKTEKCVNIPRGKLAVALGVKQLLCSDKTSQTACTLHTKQQQQQQVWPFHEQLFFESLL